MSQYGRVHPNYYNPVAKFNSTRQSYTYKYFDLLKLSPALWLDANDSSTLTTVSGAVSEWRDKSGNNRHATQTTASNRPLLVADGLNSTNVIRFDGSDDILQSTTTIDLTSGFTFFYVGRNRIRKSYQGIFRIHDSITTASSDLEVYYQVGTDNSGNLVSVANRGGAFRGSQSNDALPILNTFGVTQISHISSTSEERRVDGGSLLPVSQSYGTGSFFPSIANNYYIGVGYGDGSRFDGDISQILIFPRVLTQTEREQVEGYLAWSTGLQDNLPASHPYKTIKP